MRHSLCKKSLESPKTRDISLKARDISQKTRDFSKKAKDISQKTRDILKPKAVLSVYTEDAAELPLLKCNKIQNQFLRAHAYARIYTRVLCFLLSHLSQCLASICKTLRYIVFEGFWPYENPVDCCHTSWRSSEISLSCLLLGRNALPFLLPFSLRVTEVTAKKQNY